MASGTINLGPTIGGSGGGGGGVTSLNALTGAVTISAGANITLTPVGNNIAISAAGLANNNGQVFTADTSSSAGYTFNSANTEFVGSVIRQKAHASGIPTFTSPQNVTVASGSLVKNAGGIGTYDAGAISVEQIASGDGFVQFQFVAGSDGVSAGLEHAHPDYSYNTIGYSFNTTGGTLYIFESGTLINSYGAWSPTDVLKVGIESGSVVYRQNGSVLYTSLVAPTYIQFFVASISNVGSGVEDIIMSAPPLNQYVGDAITFPVFNYAGIGSIQSFAAFTVTDANTPHYTINGLYWNGSAWVSSDESYAQSNPKATVNTNIGALPASNSVVVRMITQSDAAQMSLSALSITYVGQISAQGAAIHVFNSNPSVGGAVAEALTVTGLLTTDTILSVTQRVQGAATRTALSFIGWHTVVTNGLTAEWVADPGPGAILLVSVLR